MRSGSGARCRVTEWGLGAEKAAEADTASGSTFVGSASCRGCHVDEHARWEGSHHSLAMQEVNEETVLGDFGGTSFSHFGQQTRFHRDGEKFLVTTDGPDGKMQTYEVPTSSEFTRCSNIY